MDEADNVPLMKRHARILVIDDHEEMVELLAEQLRDEEFIVDVSTDGRTALVLANERLPDLVITDLRMRGFDGFDVLKAFKELDPDLPVLIMTAFGGVDSAVEAIKQGAAHYFTKPFRLDEVLIWVNRALDARSIQSENRRLRAERSRGIDRFVGQSAAMQRLRERIGKISSVDAPVLIRGESGTGKELVARAIHEAGLRAAAPFVAVNCTSLPQELLESELFGHAKGAFTGAANARRGLFLEADGGTLFLDEIGDMPAELQAKLLRVLQEKEIRPVGSDASRKVDVRIIAATHQPLEDLIKSGKFREDLFFRLDVLNVQVPPLRERREDIETLARHFFDKYRVEFKSSVRELPSELLERFLRAPWVGNVRELENAVQRYVILGEFDPVQAQSEDSSSLDLFNLREVEDRHIRRVLDYCGGNKTQAAELLGIDASTIHRKLSRP